MDWHETEWIAARFLTIVGFHDAKVGQHKPTELYAIANVPYVGVRSKPT